MWRHPKLPSMLKHSKLAWWKASCPEYPLPELGVQRPFYDPYDPCQVLIHDLPTNLNLGQLYTDLSRAGWIQSIEPRASHRVRDRVDVSLRYATPEDAMLCREVMCHLITDEGKKLDMEPVTVNNRLHVKHLERGVSAEIIRYLFQSRFPAMKRMFIINMNHRFKQPYAYIDFADQASAAEAMTKFEVDGLRIWDRDLKLEWANPDWYVSGNAIEIKRFIDYDAELSLTCLANGWEQPIILYGSYDSAQDIQYVAVILKVKTGQHRTLIFKVKLTVDLQGVVAKAVLDKIEQDKGFPVKSHLIDLTPPNWTILGDITFNGGYPILQFNAEQNLEGLLQGINTDEIGDLAYASGFLMVQNSDVMQSYYNHTFPGVSGHAYLPWQLPNGRIFGILQRGFQVRIPQMPKNVDPQRMVLCLCDIITGMNYAQLADRSAHLRQVRHLMANSEGVEVKKAMAIKEPMKPDSPENNSEDSLSPIEVPVPPTKRLASRYRVAHPSMGLVSNMSPIFE